MNENIRQFPNPDISPQVLEKNQLMKLAEKLRPQGASEKVKRHIEILAGMIDSIRADGFELLIDDDVNTDGSAGRVKISLTSSDWADLEISIIEENFSNDNDFYFDIYQNEEAIRGAYRSAKDRAYQIIGKRAVYLMKEGRLAVSKDTNTPAQGLESEKTAA